MTERLRRLTGVRGRSAAVATLLVAVTVVAASFGFVVAQRHQLYSSAASLAEQEASDRAAQLTSNRGDVTLQSLVSGEQSLIQVVDDRGRVIAASTSSLEKRPMVSSRPSVGGPATHQVASLHIEEEELFMVGAVQVSTPAGPRTVLAAQSLEGVAEATQVTTGLLAVGVPVFLGVVFLISLWLTRRALRPVDAMRRRVATLSTTDLHGRLPVPAGGDEVSKLAVTMNEMLARIEVSAARQRQFVSDASHELRSPLATIRSAHEVGIVHPGTVDWETASAEVLAELDGLEHLVDDLLYLARIDEVAGQMRGDDVDLDDLVLAEADRVSRLGRVKVIADVEHVRLVGDARRLARAFRNLGDNAVRHAHGEVRIRLSAEPLQVDFLDDGDGIPPDDRERVFERFVRLDDSRSRDSGGSGLGLAIARQIVEAHGGTITALAAPGTGTLMRIAFPPLV